MAQDGVVVAAGARTPFVEWAGGKTGSGAPGGAFKDLTALELGAVALKAALERSRVPPEAVDHVVFGNALQTGPDAIYGARHVGLRAGLPAEVPALSVARICGTGIQAAVTGAGLIRLGEASIVAVGGTENLSQAPYVVRGLRGSAPKLKHMELEDYFLSSLLDPMCGLLMAQTAENVARKYGVTRAEQDALALRSHQEALRAAKEGLFQGEIVPVEVGPKGRKTVVGEDDHPFPGCTADGLAGLKPYFSADGFVTAGNASGVTDGACALVLASENAAKARGLPRLGRIVSYAVAGVAPDEMGLGPVPAIRKALDAAGLKVSDVDLFEINEAFAAQYVACEKQLGLDRAKCNVNGGAIALGHPLAATGARLMLTVLLELGRRKKRYGVASACIGGGQGIAIVLER